MKKQLLLFGLLIILFSACKKTSFNAPKQATIDDDKIAAYIAANHIDVTKDASTGIYYKITNVNTDTDSRHPTVTDTVKVTYSGKLLNGTVFQPTSTSISAVADFIKGWQIALPLMTTSGKEPFTRMRLIIPSALGYGVAGANGVPPNSCLDFNIDLLGFYGN